MNRLPDKFLNAILAVVKQGRQSLSADGACMYRGPDGCKCAIGHMIPDDDYDLRFEGNTIDDDGDFVDMGVPLIAKAAGILRSEADFAWRLQKAHDLADPENFTPEFLRRTREALTDFDYTIPDEIAEVAE
ncbi:MAG TPA: hypothetical protein DCX29_01705 [Hyphomonas sp.]|nr:hypothetical protein [Hyphomonas sp.]|tara:strand:- start:1750 stop:2142 length:393 start_codon:yes stop_codon:yes gene_type:complete